MGDKLYERRGNPEPSGARPDNVCGNFANFKSQVAYRLSGGKRNLTLFTLELKKKINK
jgi:hypothetical protein